VNHVWVTRELVDSSAVRDVGDFVALSGALLEVLVGAVTIAVLDSVQSLR